MKTLKLILLISTFATLFSCTPPPQKITDIKTTYLKNDISQSELQNKTYYKRYFYTCHNFETGTKTYLSTYFPLSKESRMKENFGFYFQLDNDKAHPFDHIENKALNKRGTRFEVIYRSYNLIQGSYIDLIARQRSSSYYKKLQWRTNPLVRM